MKRKKSKVDLPIFYVWCVSIKSISKKYFNVILQATSVPDALILACNHFMDENPDVPIDKVDIARDDEI